MQVEKQGGRRHGDNEATTVVSTVEQTHFACAAQGTAS
jgi:hypothetical protein